uniref:Uncharacterized protein n=1 Tax=Megaselia scalaris TaxID=36166 RepID=T1GR99_MEGSC
MEIEQYDDSIKHLQRAHDISKEQKQNFGDDITSQIRICRKKKWTQLEETRIFEESRFQAYLT